MNTQRIVVFFLLLALLALGGGAVWLAVTPLAPTSQTVEQAVPDDQIPR